MTYEEHIGPYLLGTYEMELHPWWEQVRLRSFRQVIDVGAKFGYYAVGLAKQFPIAVVVAFDTDWWARKALREMIEANRVQNVTVRSSCTPKWLSKHLQPGALIVSDCEGYERDLFCTLGVPSLTSATLIIETHEQVSPGVRSDLINRFQQTHEIRSVDSRSVALLPNLPVRSLKQDELRRVANEVRPPQTWLLLLPRTGGRTAC